jgi:hypothetical protein
MRSKVVSTVDQVLAVLGQHHEPQCGKSYSFDITSKSDIKLLPSTELQSIMRTTASSMRVALSRIFEIQASRKVEYPRQSVKSAVAFFQT